MSKYQDFLSAAHRQELTTLLVNSSLKRRERLRILSLQAIDSGDTYESIKNRYTISEASLVTLVKNYQQTGLKCLYDAPRSGRPLKHLAIHEDQITLLAHQDAPTGHSQWSLRLLADKAVELGYCEHLSHTQVNKVLKKRKSNPI